MGTSKIIQIEPEIDPKLFPPPKQKVQQTLSYKLTKPNSTRLHENEGNKSFVQTTNQKECIVRPWKAPSWTSVNAQPVADNDEYDDLGFDEACKLFLISLPAYL